MADFQQSADYMAEAINAQKDREQSADVLQTIEDLTKMREDILIKIADVKETKELVWYSKLNIVFIIIVFPKSFF